MSAYITIEEANEYVETHYVSTDPLRLSWESLEDSDKQVYLNVSSEAIDNLPWPGRKACPDQEHAFPRYPQMEMPPVIKFAAVENALSLGDEDAQQDAATYQKMWSYGISSYSIGTLSETMGTAGGNASAKTEMASSGIISSKAQALLSRYMRGGYCIG